jgi:hypothetical protein
MSHTNHDESNEKAVEVKLVITDFKDKTVKGRPVTASSSHGRLRPFHSTSATSHNIASNSPDAYCLSHQIAGPKPSKRTSLYSDSSQNTRVGPALVHQITRFQNQTPDIATGKKSHHTNDRSLHRTESLGGRILRPFLSDGHRLKGAIKGLFSFLCCLDI